MDSILQGQEEERKRIASDLHDGLGALLATARIQLRNIEKEISALQQVPLFSSAEKTITQASTEVRRISHNMMPSAVEDLGLTAALEDLVLDLRQNSDIQVEVEFPK